MLLILFFDRANSGNYKSLFISYFIQKNNYFIDSKCYVIIEYYQKFTHQFIQKMQDFELLYPIVMHFFDDKILKTLASKFSISTGLTLFGARHYCHIVFVCSWAQARPYFWREDSPTREHEPQCQLRLSLIYRNSPELLRKQSGSWLLGG
jgi:hypothetical protein